VSAERVLRIGEVAQRTGTTPRTIRYYEEIGLLPTAPGREPGSHRLYDESDVERLEELLRLRDLLGISLEELRELAAAESARAALRKEWHSGGGAQPHRRPARADPRPPSRPRAPRRGADGAPPPPALAPTRAVRHPCRLAPDYTHEIARSVRQVADQLAKVRQGRAQLRVADFDW
jgi:DNA-binding transcriptional MerR regulator